MPQKFYRAKSEDFYSFHDDYTPEVIKKYAAADYQTGYNEDGM